MQVEPEIIQDEIDTIRQQVSWLSIAGACRCPVRGIRMHSKVWSVPIEVVARGDSKTQMCSVVHALRGRPVLSAFCTALVSFGYALASIRAFCGVRFPARICLWIPCSYRFLWSSAISSTRTRSLSPVRSRILQWKVRGVGFFFYLVVFSLIPDFRDGPKMVNFYFPYLYSSSGN